MISIKRPRPPAIAAALCAAAVSLAIAIGTVASCRPAEPLHGAAPRLAAQFELPREQLDRFAAFVPTRPLPDEPRQGASTSDWVSGPIAIDVAMNPHAVIVTIEGHAVADGAVSVALNAGWREPGGERLLLNLPEAREPAAEAAQPVRLVLTSPPVRLSGTPSDLLLALVGAQNLHFERVRVQVWAGPRPSNPGSTAAIAALLFAAAALAAWAWPRRGS